MARRIRATNFEHPNEVAGSSGQFQRPSEAEWARCRTHWQVCYGQTAQQKNHRSLAGWLAGRLAGKLCEILRRLTESEETLRTHYRSVYLWDGRFWSPCGCWHSGVQYLILKTNHASNMFVNCLKFNLLNSYGVDSGVDPSGCRPGCNPPKVRALA